MVSSLLLSITPVTFTTKILSWQGSAIAFSSFIFSVFINYICSIFNKIASIQILFSLATTQIFRWLAWFYYETILLSNIFGGLEIVFFLVQFPLRKEPN